MDTTFDGLLNHRVTLEQPIKGFRIAIDTVLLAAAVPVETGQRVLEFGCGVGGAMLALASRVHGVSIDGIEIQAELVELCRRNIQRNPTANDLTVCEGDIAQVPLLSAYEHVMMNPPYHNETRHSVSACHSKRQANTAMTDTLPLWISSASQALKPGGVLTLIHRADCLQEILRLALLHCGGVEWVFLQPKDHANPKRVIVRATKGTESLSWERQSLVLHREDGKYTDVLEDILRHAKPLEFH